MNDDPVSISRRTLPLVAVLLLAGCATADRAQFADGATTWYGLSQGYTEANPVLSGLSGPEILAVKLAAVQAAKLTPTEFCEPLLYWMTVQGFGLALWNIGVRAVSGPAAIPVIAGLWVWRHEHWKDNAAKTCENPWGKSQYEYEIVRVRYPDGDRLITRTFPTRSESNDSYRTRLDDLSGCDAGSVCAQRHGDRMNETLGDMKWQP